MEVLLKMKVIELSLRLTRLNPIFDSKKSDEDENMRDIFIEKRNGEKKVVASIEEVEEGTYSTNYREFKKLPKKVQNGIVEILEDYCNTPVEVRLSKGV